MIPRVGRYGAAAVLLLGWMLLAGCSEEPESPAPGGVAPGVETASPASPSTGLSELSVALLPPFPKTGDDLQAVVRGARGTCCFAWEVNGELLPDETGERLDHRHFGKGDQVQVELTVGDRKAVGTTTIGNTPPEVVTVEFEDPRIHRGVDIVAFPEGADVDGDPLRFRYRWWVNGEELTWIDGNVLPGDRFAKGDLIRLEVIPYDGVDEGRPYPGQPFVIPNAPPAIVTTPPASFQSRIYRYQVQAEDPDGDPVSYVLEEGPPGMELDADSGLLTWDLADAGPGEHRVRIAVVDPEGMTAYQEYLVQLAPGGGS